VLRVGLTGGIGSGKSEVARLLAAHGAVVVDSDALAREVVAPGTPGLAAVVAAFGPGVLAPDGGLDRPALAALVFADPAARERLNAIVHPLVAAAAAERTAGVPGDAVVVHDVPLLVEAGLAGGFDVVVVVDAPEDVRLARLTGRRGMSPEDASARMRAQATREERLAAAGHVIANDGTLQDLAERVDTLWAALTHPGDTVT
jgi:dephospho-CoA kinase